MSKRIWNNFKDWLGANQFARSISPSVWTAYTPTWTASSTDPVAATHTLTGRFTRNDFFCFAEIELQFASGSDIGSGTYKWTLPVKRLVSESTRAIGSAMAFDNSTGIYYTGVVVAQNSDGISVSVATHGDASFTGHDTPIASPAANDRITLSILYPIGA